MKKLLLLVTITFFVGKSFSQDAIVPEKEIFMGQDEKLYVNRTSPVYLMIATSPDENAEQHILKSKITAKYSNPMYLDTEGYNSFRAPSAVDTVTKQIVYPMRDIVYEVYADSRAPKTTVNYGKTLTTYKDGKTFCSGETELTLSAKDATSGVSKIYYSIDNAAFIEYSEPIKLIEGEYFLQYYSVDNVGNMEIIRISKIVINNI